MKKFIIIGNMNAITYKEIFPLLKDNKVRLGYSKIKTFCTRTGTKDFGNVGWYTTLPVEKKTLTLTSTYDPDKYPKYDNYDAIDCGKVAEIPMDYNGVIGVPITFLDKYCPEQFEIIGATESEGKGFSNGLWDEKSGVAQALVKGQRVYKRIFIRKRTA